MVERKSVLLLVIIVTVVARAIGGVSISVFYETAFEEERAPSAGGGPTSPQPP